jgi:hypothetical protein
MLEQRHFIRFLIKEGIRPKEIPGRLRNVYGEGAMKKTQVLFWAAEVRRGREDLSDEERPGRPATPDLMKLSPIASRKIHTRRPAHSLPPWASHIKRCLITCTTALR